VAPSVHASRAFARVICHLAGRKPATPRGAPVNARIMRTHLLLIIGFATTLFSACRKETEPSSATSSPFASATASPDRVPVGITAVQNEMRLLHEAMRSCVTAVAYGTLDSIPESLHTVHRARELTEKLATFKELDEQFHDELEKLLTVATSKDGAATGIQVGVVLSKCSGCHAQFRP
jgi:hypothetical protein